MTFCFSCSEVVQLAVFGERIGKEVAEAKKKDEA